MLQLYRFMSIDGTFMFETRYPDLTSRIISCGSKSPFPIHVQAILISGMNLYGVARMLALGFALKISAVSRFCMCFTRTPFSIRDVFDDFTPSSSSPYHPRL